MFKVALLIAPLVTILVGCTTPPATLSGTVEPPPATATTVPRTLEPPRATATPMPESSERILRGPGGRQVVLHLWLEVPQKARPGESVPLVLKIQNRNNEPVELFHGFAPFDFLVQREDGTEVWSWLQVIGPIPAALRSTTLQPGQTLDYREPPYTSSAWGQDDDDCTPGPIGGQPCRGNPVPPGKYLVLGTFEAALSDDYARYSQTLPVGPQELLIEPYGKMPTHYLALGDSIAWGQGASMPRFEYVERVNKFYRVNHRGPERLAKLAVYGETSSSLLAAQIKNAVETINDARTDAEVATLSIGSNDFLPLMRSEPCASSPVTPECQAVVAQALKSFAANYQASLVQLTAALAADPGNERVLVTTYYNPFDGTGNPFEGPVDLALLGTDDTIDCTANAADPSKLGLNDLIACIGEGFGAEIVDIYPIFDGQALALTHIGEGDFHPNDDGHKLIGDAVIATYTGA